MKEQELKKAQNLIKKIQQDLISVTKLLEEAVKIEPKDIPGIEGTFTGIEMLTDAGEKYEVPANYAAKSRLVYGDRLKMVEQDGKKFFKQVVKVPRKKVEGVISKKEGEWYFLADSGSYKISATAAEFNNIELNDEVLALIPAQNLAAPYAAFDKFIKPKEKATIGVSVSPADQKPPQVAKPQPVEHTTQQKQSQAENKADLRQKDNDEKANYKAVNKPKHNSQNNSGNSVQKSKQNTATVAVQPVASSAHPAKNKYGPKKEQPKQQPVASKTHPKTQPKAVQNAHAKENTPSPANNPATPAETISADTTPRVLDDDDLR